MPHAPDHQRGHADGCKRDRQERHAHRIETVEHAVLQHQEFVRVDQPHHEIGQAAKQQPEDDAHQHHQMQAAHRIREQPPEQQAGKRGHGADFQQEGRHRVVRGRRRLPEPDHHNGLDQQVQRIEAHDRRRQDAVVRNGLEEHRRHRHGIRHQQHRRQLAAAKRNHERPLAVGAQGHECHDAYQGGHAQPHQAQRLRRAPNRLAGDGKHCLSQGGSSSCATATGTGCCPARRRPCRWGFHTGG
ncbi:hypothetical protein G6F22_014868 [Rhizopus arrhizus]|nr:hypothetical protein G6F22_014868 [Rhizopus arrhizus]